MVTWTLDRVDPAAHRVAAFLRDDLGVPPIALVEDLERVYKIGDKDGSAVRVDRSGFVVLEGNPAIHFPVSLLGNQKTLSLPVLLFSALFGPPVHLCFVWSRLMHLRTVESHELGIVHQALFVVGEWYADVASNPPLVDAALMVERPDLRLLVSRFAYVLRLATCSLTRSTDLLRDLMQPWSVGRLDPFWKDLERAIVGAVVYIRAVELASIDPPTARCRPGVNALPDFFFDNNVALVCTPTDKIVLTAVLLYSREINLVHRSRLDPRKFCEDQRVPKPLRPVLTLLAKAHTQPIIPPKHYAHDHRQLRRDGRADPEAAGEPERAGLEPGWTA